MTLSSNKQREIAEMLMNGDDRSTIKARIMSELSQTKDFADDVINEVSESWNIPLPKVNEEIEKIFSTLAYISDESKRNETLLAYARLTELYRLNMIASPRPDLKECREVQKEINKLLGLNAPERSEIKTDIETEFIVTVVNAPQIKK